MTVLKQPCEMTYLKVLPAVRSKLTAFLIENANMKQTEISELLGITQAAVSFYTSEKRGDETLIDEYPEVEGSIEELGKDLIKGISALDRQKRICEICRNLQNQILRDRPEK